MRFSFEVINNSITAAFTPLAIAVFSPDFVKGVAGSGDLIAGGFAFDQFINDRFNIFLICR